MIEQVEKLLAARMQALKNGDIKEAQAIKNELERFNVTITDTPNGTEYRIN